MRVLHPDPSRRIALDGVAEPVPRPVDIDAAQTGFTALRTLRIYQFDAGTQIEGHAEEDEVLIVALAGVLELTLRAGDAQQHVQLHAPGTPSPEPGVAYLPPHGEYVLKAATAADVAYARATPRTARPPATFAPVSGEVDFGWRPVVTRVKDHAERLRLEMRFVDPAASTVRLGVAPDAPPVEALVHLPRGRGGALRITEGEDGVSERIEAGDTLALAPRADLRIAALEAPSLLCLCVWAH